VLTLGDLVNRPDLGLRFADDRDAARYAGRTVETVVEGVRALEAGSALREVLVVVSAGEPPPSWPALARPAGMVAAGCDGGVPEAMASAARRHDIPLLAAPDDATRVWTRTFRVMRQEHRLELRRQADRLKAMRKTATEPDGLRNLLRSLAREVSGHAVLADAAGEPVSAYPDVPTGVLERVREDVLRVATRRVRSAAVDLAPQVAYLLALGDEEPGAVLVVVRDRDFPPRMRALVAEATGYLYLRWRVEELGRRDRQVGLADMHSREATLHLLMVGDVQAARRVSSALGASLPDITRVYIVECPVGLRDEYARRCAEVTGGRAWLVRCPVFRRQLIVLAPAESEEADDPVDRALRSLANRRPDCFVGAGQAVGLRDTAEGYQQAYHALAVARGVPARCATFSSREEITTLLGPGGRVWAARLLWPLLEHRPERRQDPDADELRVTLAAWLTFANGAARLLKIHRNTLTARIGHIGRLLGRDLNDLGTQSELHLALRLLDRTPSREPGGDVPLDELFDPPAMLHWARACLAPIGDERLLETLRAWLDADARLDLTATALGLSVPATRKRLLRVEGIIGRSLLTRPSARYDLALAFRALARHDAY
jgi:sugar diacid utilization regulator